VYKIGIRIKTRRAIKGLCCLLILQCVHLATAKRDMRTGLGFLNAMMDELKPLEDSGGSLDDDEFHDATDEMSELGIGIIEIKLKDA